LKELRGVIFQFERNIILQILKHVLQMQRLAVIYSFYKNDW